MHGDSQQAAPCCSYHDQVHLALRMDIVVGQGAAVLKLFAGKYQFLTVGGQACSQEGRTVFAGVAVVRQAVGGRTPRSSRVSWRVIFM